MMMKRRRMVVVGRTYRSPLSYLGRPKGTVGITMPL
jgi:hypothetical protein